MASPARRAADESPIAGGLSRISWRPLHRRQSHNKPCNVVVWPFCMDRPRVASRKEVVGLALLYPALERNVCVPGHHGYPRALDLIRDSAPKAIRAT